MPGWRGKARLRGFCRGGRLAINIVKRSKDKAVTAVAVQPVGLIGALA